MGFNKRYITKDTIKNLRNPQDIKFLIKSDALMLDEWASKFISRLSEDKFSLSDVWINLKTSPSAKDIEFCKTIFSNIEESEIPSQFEDMCFFYISIIEKEFEK